MTNNLKEFQTIGCCGIDCGLCPRFHTKGSSACPGCGGPGFRDKHPSCGFLTCCVLKRGNEVCSGCAEYPCKRFDAEKNGYDSFVTHRKVFDNLDFIKNHGILPFIENQKIRMDVLTGLLEKHDDGRSKSFYCLACALLPLEKLLDIQLTVLNLSDGTDVKENCRRVKAVISESAASMDIDLKLRNKKLRS